MNSGPRRAGTRAPPRTIPPVLMNWDLKRPPLGDPGDLGDPGEGGKLWQLQWLEKELVVC